MSLAAAHEQLLKEVFRDIQNYQERGKCYQPKPKAEADNTYRDLDSSGYHEKTEFNNCLVLTTKQNIQN